ncbi:MAG: PP2C family serine/threonine-protein phosphatase [Chloroflexota bacterium]
MSDEFHLHHYPVFEEGIFAKYPTLFDQFPENSHGRLRSKLRQVQKVLPEYEGTLTWPLLTGPGFCGGTHPGAETVFTEIVLGPNNSFYNSDCLYANPAKRVFAVADPPGISEYGRRIFRDIDAHLKTGTVADLENVINRINYEMAAQRETATLALVCFPEDTPGRALAFVAGDTLLFHGNALSKQLKPVTGSPYFIGAAHIPIVPQEIELAPGDFFIIASDGILTLNAHWRAKRPAEFLLEHINGNIDNFALNAITACNDCCEEKHLERVAARFGGSDNVTVLLVCPEKLPAGNGQKSFILGGHAHIKHKLPLGRTKP